MSKVFKNTTVAYLNPQKRKCKKSEAVIIVDGKTRLRPGYRRKRTKTRKYYFKLRGRDKKIPLSQDRMASEQIAAEKIADDDRAQHGLGDKYEKFAAMPLEAHPVDFLREMEMRGSTPSHRQQVAARLNRVFVACEFRSLSDLSVTPVSEYLANRRCGNRIRQPLDRKKIFTPFAKPQRSWRSRHPRSGRWCSGTGSKPSAKAKLDVSLGRPSRPCRIACAWE